MLTVPQQLHLAVLVWIQFANAVLVEIAACQPTELLGAEPGLRVKPDRMEWPIVANKESWDLEISHC